MLTHLQVRPNLQLQGETMLSDPQIEIGVSRNRWLLSGVLVVLLVAGGVWLWHSGFLEELYDKDRLVAALREDGFKGPLLSADGSTINTIPC